VLTRKDMCALGDAHGGQAKSPHFLLELAIPVHRMRIASSQDNAAKIVSDKSLYFINAWELVKKNLNTSRG
jgi:hypothetical protein